MTRADTGLVHHPEPEPAVAAVLFVCTGNLCRSPLAERLGRAYVEEFLPGRGAELRLTSAGTQGVVGSSMHPSSALVLEGLGGDPEGFLARRLEAAHVEAADLVLTMTRDHRRDVLALAPRALRRTFTLPEAAGLLDLVDGDPIGPDGPYPERVRHLVGALAEARSRRLAGEADDIPDPIGRPLEVHQAVGEAIAAALLPVLVRFVALHPRV